MSKYVGSFSGDLEFLSNMYKIPIYFNETKYDNFQPDFKVYPSSENLYQALKSLDRDFQEYIRNLPWPALAKKSGKMKYFNNCLVMREDFEDIKNEIMYTCVSEKFKQNYALQLKLVELKDYKLYENNIWHDNYWGNCICDKCKDKVGQNHLGKILMRVRDELIKN